MSAALAVPVLTLLPGLPVPQLQVPLVALVVLAVQAAMPALQPQRLLLQATAVPVVKAVTVVPRAAPVPTTAQAVLAVPVVMVVTA